MRIGALLVLLTWALAGLWIIALVVIAVRTAQGRNLIGAIASILLFAFCVYGLIASREPGVISAWKVAYGFGGVLGLHGAAIQSLWILARLKKNIQQTDL